MRDFAARRDDLILGRFEIICVDNCQGRSLLFGRATVHARRDAAILSVAVFVAPLFELPAEDVGKECSNSFYFLR